MVLPKRQNFSERSSGGAARRQRGYDTKGKKRKEKKTCQGAKAGLCKHSLSSETGQFSIQPLGKKKKKKNKTEEHANVSEVQKRREENGGA